MRRSIFTICEELVDRQIILKNGQEQYGQDDIIFNLIEELNNYLREEEETE
jgi:hypothetical protein